MRARRSHNKRDAASEFPRSQSNPAKPWTTEAPLCDSQDFTGLLPASRCQMTTARFRGGGGLVESLPQRVGGLFWQRKRGGRRNIRRAVTTLCPMGACVYVCLSVYRCRSTAKHGESLIQFKCVKQTQFLCHTFSSCLPPSRIS